MRECTSTGEGGKRKEQVWERGNSVEFSCWMGSLQDLKGSKASGGKSELKEAFWKQQRGK